MINIKNKIFKIFIITILLLETNFLYIIPLKDNFLTINSLYHKYLICIIMLFLTLINYKTIIKAKSQFTLFTLFWILLYICTFIMSKLSYGGNWMPYIRESFHFIIPITYIGIVVNIKSDDMFTFIEDTLMFFSIIVIGIFIIQVLAYPTKGLIIHSILEGRFRFGNIRIHDSAQLIRISSIIGLANIVRTDSIKRRKIVGTICVLGGLIYEFYVEKSVAAIGVLLLTLIITFLIRYRRRSFKIFLGLIIASIIFIITFNSSIGDKYNEVIANKNSLSYVAREGAIEYYIDNVKDRPFFGMGFIPYTSTYDENYYLLRGNDGIFYRDDIGIVGYLSTFGIVGLLIFIGLIIKIGKINILLIRSGYIDRYPESVGYFIYLILSSATMIVTDPQYIVMFPFILSSIDYIYISYN